MVNIKRVRNLKKGRPVSGPVLYWMSRDQRVHDNWALAFAIEVAENENQSVMVVFNLAEKFPDATWRQFDFLLQGLRKVESRLSALNIPFMVLIGDPLVNLPKFMRQHKISRLITDFDPSRLKHQWQAGVTELTDVTVDIVDAHNVVPCHLASDREEYAAFTFRPKIRRLLPEFLDKFPPLIRQRGKFHPQRINWNAVAIAVKTDHGIRPVEWMTPGEKGALAVLEKFLNGPVSNYAHNKNDPNEKDQSGLSPYLHFGHISAQRIVLEVTGNMPATIHTEAFLDDLIIRRELSENFCLYNPNYDNIHGLRPWAKESLENHRFDRRAYLYTPEQFERALTHDSLWNATMLQMVYTGTMNGYLRMYWAKKILEWSASPEDALQTALTLNNRYQLDGRDPISYAGCAWSVGGVHDMPCREREIFGNIRYMNRKGCERSFDVEKYITGIKRLERHQGRISC